MLLREVLLVEQFRRGNDWRQVANIFNALKEMTFRVNQRSVTYRCNLLVKGSPKSKQKRGDSSETFAFLMSRVETELGHKIKHMTTCYLQIGNRKSMFT